jgi:hypothetical protein
MTDTQRNDASTSTRSRIGLVLARGVVPLWIVAGASFKLWERNPQLLPKPVTDVTDAIFVRGLGFSREAYLGPALRAMIAIEIAWAITMVLGPARLARWMGIEMLGLFCTILVVLIASGAASCGCFGAGGPSPGWMLAIDATLLVALLACPPGGPRAPAAADLRRTLAVAAVAAGIGATVVFAVPDRAAVALPADGDAPAQPAPAVAPDPAAPTAPPATNPQVPAADAARPWPAQPATAKPWYAPEFAEWKGKRLDEQEVMLLASRNLPFSLNEGRRHVVFMREDCEHCHALLNAYFSGPLPAPTVTIAIPDATGDLLENPCGACAKATMPGGITYVFSTPVLLTVQDGVVVGVCTDSEDAEAVRAALNAR